MPGMVSDARKALDDVGDPRQRPVAFSDITPGPVLIIATFVWLPCGWGLSALLCGRRHFHRTVGSCYLAARQMKRFEGHGIRLRHGASCGRCAWRYSQYLANRGQGWSQK